MNIAVFGTGMVGNTIGSKLISLGHNVMMGSRTAGNEKATAWAASQGISASNGTYADAAAFGELIFNCTSGIGSMEAFKQAGAANINRKVVIDISNPLDFSKGMPPSLSVCNTDSLSEQLQREFPEAKIVKTLNTVNCNIMVNPAMLAGDHDMMLCGNDTDAKVTVKDILMNWFGWKTVHDLGDLTGARGMEMWLPLWLRFMMTTGTANFNIRLVK
jgi:predicted dinucleotide-binding enzyme